MRHVMYIYGKRAVLTSPPLIGASSKLSIYPTSTGPSRNAETSVKICSLANPLHNLLLACNQMSFEERARTAIERVYGAHENDPQWTSNETERWVRAVRVVLHTIIPNLSASGSVSWSTAIRDELLRLQREEEHSRAAALAILNKRLELILREYPPAVLPSRPIFGALERCESVKRPSSGLAHVSPKEVKRRRASLKRSRPEQVDQGEHGL
jgi:hypothetical protein